MVTQKPDYTSKTAGIILELSVCVFLNILGLIETVVLNYSTVWLLTPRCQKKLYYNMSVLDPYVSISVSASVKTRSSNFPELLMMMSVA